MDLTIKPCQKLSGTVTMPGDKSISHRAVMLGSLATGRTEIHNFLMGEDCLATIKCFKALGVDIQNQQHRITIQGRGLHGLKEPAVVLDCGNSGTTTRLLLGILAGQSFSSIITGDSSLCQRPMARIVTPLNRMGAQFIGRYNNSLLPMAVKGGGLQPINYLSPVASAQIKSAILLAGLFCPGRTVVTEPSLSRDHTERMLSLFGAEVAVSGRHVSVTGYPRLTGKKITIPGDISAAAFFMVAAAILPGSDVTITNVGLNPTRTGVVEVLKRMGAHLKVTNLQHQDYEPVGDIHIKGSALTGTVIEGDIIPRLIDEIPILAVAASVAQGKTVFRDAAELRVKETDRITALATELTKLGVNIQTRPDGMVIEGGGPLLGTTCHSHGDHRMAMALAVAGLVAAGQTTIKEATSINVSFPDFMGVLNSIMVV